MSESAADRPVQPGEPAPNFVLDAITREGKVALNDFRGRKPVFVGLYRGLHCAFCRRHIAAMAQLGSALSEKGVESLTVVNTPIERARLYFRYHPLPNLLAAADPERASHRAFGLPAFEFTENETDWPRKVGMNVANAMRVVMPGDLPEPMAPHAASQVLDKKYPYEVTEADEGMIASGGNGQLVGQFLIDREGVVRWIFTEYDGNGRNMFGAPTPHEVMSAAAQIA
jgi:peroxiredoxin